MDSVIYLELIKTLEENNLLIEKLIKKIKEDKKEKTKGGC